MVTGSVTTKDAAKLHPKETRQQSSGKRKSKTQIGSSSSMKGAVKKQSLKPKTKSCDPEDSMERIKQIDSFVAQQLHSNLMAKNRISSIVNRVAKNKAPTLANLRASKRNATTKASVLSWPSKSKSAPLKLPSKSLHARNPISRTSTAAAAARSAPVLRHPGDVVNSEHKKSAPKRTGLTSYVLARRGLKSYIDANSHKSALPVKRNPDPYDRFASTSPRIKTVSFTTKPHLPSSSTSVRSRSRQKSEVKSSASLPPSLSECRKKVSNQTLPAGISCTHRKVKLTKKCKPVKKRTMSCKTDESTLPSAPNLTSCSSTDKVCCGDGSILEYAQVCHSSSTIDEAKINFHQKSPNHLNEQDFNNGIVLGLSCSNDVNSSKLPQNSNAEQDGSGQAMHKTKDYNLSGKETWGVNDLCDSDDDLYSCGDEASSAAMTPDLSYCVDSNETSDMAALEKQTFSESGEQGKITSLQFRLPVSSEKCDYVGDAGESSNPPEEVSFPAEEQKLVDASSVANNPESIHTTSKPLASVTDSSVRDSLKPQVELLSDSNDKVCPPAVQSQVSVTSGKILDVLPSETYANRSEKGSPLEIKSVSVENEEARSLVAKLSCDHHHTNSNVTPNKSQLNPTDQTADNLASSQGEKCSTAAPEDLSLTGDEITLLTQSSKASLPMTTNQASEKLGNPKEIFAPNNIQGACNSIKNKSSTSFEESEGRVCANVIAQLIPPDVHGDNEPVCNDQEESDCSGASMDKKFLLALTSQLDCEIQAENEASENSKVVETHGDNSQPNYEKEISDKQVLALFGMSSSDASCSTTLPGYEQLHHKHCSADVMGTAERRLNSMINSKDDTELGSSFEGPPEHISEPLLDRMALNKCHCSNTKCNCNVTCCISDEPAIQSKSCSGNSKINTTCNNLNLKPLQLITPRKPVPAASTENEFNSVEETSRACQKSLPASVFVDATSNPDPNKVSLPDASSCRSMKPRSNSILEDTQIERASCKSSAPKAMKRVNAAKSSDKDFSNTSSEISVSSRTFRGQYNQAPPAKKLSNVKVQNSPALRASGWSQYMSTELACRETGSDSSCSNLTVSCSVKPAELCKTDPPSFNQTTLGFQSDHCEDSLQNIDGRALTKCNDRPTNPNSNATANSDFHETSFKRVQIDSSHSSDQQTIKVGQPSLVNSKDHESDANSFKRSNTITQLPRTISDKQVKVLDQNSEFSTSTLTLQSFTKDCSLNNRDQLTNQENIQTTNTDLIEIMLGDPKPNLNEVDAEFHHCQNKPSSLKKVHFSLPKTELASSNTQADSFTTSSMHGKSENSCDNIKNAKPNFDMSNTCHFQSSYETKEHSPANKSEVIGNSSHLDMANLAKTPMNTIGSFYRADGETNKKTQFKNNSSEESSEVSQKDIACTPKISSIEQKDMGICNMRTSVMISTATTDSSLDSSIFNPSQKIVSSTLQSLKGLKQNDCSTLELEKRSISNKSLFAMTIPPKETKPVSATKSGQLENRIDRSDLPADDNESQTNFGESSLICPSISSDRSFKKFHSSHHQHGNVSTESELQIACSGIQLSNYQHQQNFAKPDFVSATETSNSALSNQQVPINNPQSVGTYSVAELSKLDEKGSDLTASISAVDVPPSSHMSISKFRPHSFRLKSSSKPSKIPMPTKGFDPYYQKPAQKSNIARGPESPYLEGHEFHPPSNGVKSIGSYKYNSNVDKTSNVKFSHSKSSSSCFTPPLNSLDTDDAKLINHKTSSNFQSFRENGSAQNASESGTRYKTQRFFSDPNHMISDRHLQQECNMLMHNSSSEFLPCSVPPKSFSQSVPKPSLKSVHYNCQNMASFEAAEESSAKVFSSAGALQHDTAKSTQKLRSRPSSNVDSLKSALKSAHSNSGCSKFNSSSCPRLSGDKSDEAFDRHFSKFKSSHERCLQMSGQKVLAESEPNLTHNAPQSNHCKMKKSGQAWSEENQKPQKHFCQPTAPKQTSYSNSSNGDNHLNLKEELQLTGACYSGEDVASHPVSLVNTKLAKNMKPIPSKDRYLQHRRNCIVNSSNHDKAKSATQRLSTPALQGARLHKEFPVTKYDECKSSNVFIDSEGRLITEDITRALSPTSLQKHVQKSNSYDLEQLRSQTRQVRLDTQASSNMNSTGNKASSLPWSKSNCLGKKDTDALAPRFRVKPSCGDPDEVD